LEPPPPGQATGFHRLPHTPAEEGSVQDPGGEKGYPQDGDGALLGHDPGVEYLLTGCLAIDPVSTHLVAEHRLYRPRVLEDGGGSGQRPLCI
jgi:hypothetical protein